MAYIEKIKKLFLEYMEIAPQNTEKPYNWEEIKKDGLQVIELLTEKAAENMFFFQKKEAERKGAADHMGLLVWELSERAKNLMYRVQKLFWEKRLEEAEKNGRDTQYIRERIELVEKAAPRTFIEAIKQVIFIYYDNTAIPEEEAPPEAYKKEVVKLATPPEKHIIPNNKLANTITTAKGFNLFDINGADLIVSGRGKSEITTRCMLTYEGDNITLSGRQPFTEYDRNVADAVTSLYEYGGSNIVTAATVYRAMVNMTDTETPSPQQIGAVTRSLDKMRFTRVRIDCTEELKQRKVSLNGQQIAGGLVDTYLLAMEAIEATVGGQRVKAYKVIKTPILYEYSQLTGQVYTTPSKLLAVPDQSNTEQRIAIKSYLLRRICAMKGPTPQSNRIKFDKLYEAIGIDNPEKQERKRIKDYITAVLAYWEKEKLIKGFEFVKNGREYAAVDILFEKKTKAASK